MRKWSLIIELEPNGDWSALAMLGKQLVGSAQADNLQLVQEMGAELLQGCVESTEMSAEEEAVVKKIVWAAAVPAPGHVAKILYTTLETIAGFAVGNGDVCEIIARKARAALSAADEAWAGATAPPKEG